MPYTSTRAARLKDFERKHATSDLPAVERYRHALSILDKVSNRYQSEYSRMNEWRTFMSQKEYVFAFNPFQEQPRKTSSQKHPPQPPIGLQLEGRLLFLAWLLTRQSRDQLGRWLMPGHLPSQKEPLIRHRLL